MSISEVVELSCRRVLRVEVDLQALKASLPEHVLADLPVALFVPVDNATLALIKDLLWAPGHHEPKTFRLSNHVVETTTAHFTGADPTDRMARFANTLRSGGVFLTASDNELVVTCLGFDENQRSHSILSLPIDIGRFENYLAAEIVAPIRSETPLVIRHSHGVVPGPVGIRYVLPLDLATSIADVVEVSENSVAQWVMQVSGSKTPGEAADWIKNYLAEAAQGKYSFDLSAEDIRDLHSAARLLRKGITPSAIVYVEGLKPEFITWLQNDSHHPVEEAIRPAPVLWGTTLTWHTWHGQLLETCLPSSEDLWAVALRPRPAPLDSTDSVEEVPLIEASCRRVLRVELDLDAAAGLPDVEDHPLPAIVYIPIDDATLAQMRHATALALQLQGKTEITLPRAAHAGSSHGLNDASQISWARDQRRKLQFLGATDRPELSISVSPHHASTMVTWAWCAGDDHGIPRALRSRPIALSQLETQLFAEIQSPVNPVQFQVAGRSLPGPIGVRYLLPIDVASTIGVSLREPVTESIDELDPLEILWIESAEGGLPLNELLTPNPLFRTQSTEVDRPDLMWLTQNKQHTLCAVLPDATALGSVALPKRSIARHGDPMQMLLESAETLIERFPELNTDRELNGSDAVDRLADLLPALKLAVMRLDPASPVTAEQPSDEEDESPSFMTMR